MGGLPRAVRRRRSARRPDGGFRRPSGLPADTPAVRRLVPRRETGSGRERNETPAPSWGAMSAGNPRATGRDAKAVQGMTPDLLARVAAIAARESAKSSANREDMRAQHPELASQVDGLRAVFGAPHAVTVGGVRYGKPPLPFRRDRPDQPPIPGAGGYGHETGDRAAPRSTPRKRSGSDSGGSRNRRHDGIAGAAEPGPWWSADDERE